MRSPIVSVCPLNLASILFRHHSSRWELRESKLSNDGIGTRKLRLVYPTIPSTFPLSLPLPGRPNLS